MSEEVSVEEQEVRELIRRASEIAGYREPFASGRDSEDDEVQGDAAAISRAYRDLEAGQLLLMEQVLLEGIERLDVPTRIHMVRALVGFGYENPRYDVIGPKWAQKLIWVLQSDSSEEARKHAAWAIGKLRLQAYGEFEGADFCALEDALEKDPSAAVRGAAVLGLRDYQSHEERTARAMATALKDPDGKVRATAARVLESLSKSRPGQSVGCVLTAKSQLLEGLGDPDPQVRAAAAATLGKSDVQHRAEVLPALLDLLRDSSEDFRAAAAIGVGRMGLEPVTESRVDSWVARARKGLAALLGDVPRTEVSPACDSSGAVAALTSLLADRSLPVRIAGVKALGALGGYGQAVVPALISAVRDPEVQVGEEALASLKRVLEYHLPGNREIGDALIAALSDTRPPVRIKAIEEIQDLKDEKVLLDRAGSPLKQALSDRAFEVRAAAAVAIGNLKICDSQTVATLRQLLKDPEASVRENAVYAFGEFGERAPEVIPDLLPLLKDSTEGVRMQTAEALGYFGRDSLKMTESALKQALKDPSEKVRELAADSLGFLDS